MDKQQLDDYFGELHSELRRIEIKINNLGTAVIWLVSLVPAGGVYIGLTRWGTGDSWAGAAATVVYMVCYMYLQAKFGE